MSIKDPASELSLEKQNKILNAAKTRFMHYGVNKTTMRDIADDLGISVSNLYLYFENKRQIVLAIAEACRNEQEEFIHQVLNDASIPADQKLETLLVNKYQFMCQFRSENPKAGELIAYLLQEFPERSEKWRQGLEDMIHAALEESVRQGAFHIDDVRHAAKVMRIATDKFFLPPFIELPIEPNEAELVSLIRWITSLLQRRGGQ